MIAAVMILTAFILMVSVALVFWWLPKLLAKTERDAVRMVQASIEARFGSHLGLSERVVELCQAMAPQLGMSRKERSRLLAAARLRDLGLAAVPYGLLNGRNFNDWSEEDSDLYFRHAEIGAAILELVPSFRHLAPVVRNHHASFDGSSGPFYALGKAIPLEARVLCAITEYAWIERWQGELLACDALRAGIGTRFDPDIVAPLLRVLRSSSVVQPVDEPVPVA